MNVAKYTRSAVGGLLSHYERAKNQDGDYVKFGNSQIDTSKSHMNYNLHIGIFTQQAFLDKRLSEIKCLKRDDVNIMCTWVITAPKDLAPERHREFFQAVYSYLADKYGKNNVISAWVHLDESQSHLHFAFIPVVQDRKSGKEKVSAKELITKAELQRFHPDMQKNLEDKMQCPVNLITGETIGGNLAITELKQKTKIEKIALENMDLNQQIENKTQSLEILDEVVAIKCSEHNIVNDDIIYMESQKTVVNRELSNTEKQLKQKKDELTKLNLEIEQKSLIYRLGQFIFDLFKRRDKRVVQLIDEFPDSVKVHAFEIAESKNNSPYAQNPIDTMIRQNEIKKVKGFLSR